MSEFPLRLRNHTKLNVYVYSNVTLVTEAIRSGPILAWIRLDLAPRGAVPGAERLTTNV